MTSGFSCFPLFTCVLHPVLCHSSPDLLCWDTLSSFQFLHLAETSSACRVCTSAPPAKNVTLYLSRPKPYAWLTPACLTPPTSGEVSPLVDPPTCCNEFIVGCLSLDCRPYRTRFVSFLLTEHCLWLIVTVQWIFTAWQRLLNSCIVSEELPPCASVGFPVGTEICLSLCLV